MSDTIEITKEEKEMFYYLNELRESGETNMFGAGEYLENQFDVEKHEARLVLSKWMKNFSDNGYEHLTIV